MFRYLLNMRLLVNSVIVRLMVFFYIKATTAQINIRIKASRVEILYFVSPVRRESVCVETTRLCYSPVPQHRFSGACGYRRLSGLSRRLSG